ncbi:MAG: nitroreductase [Acidimicrobiales bacterium]|jgi:nitroreductase
MAKCDDEVAVVPPWRVDVFEVIYNCRAMRRLDTREVPDELLVKLVEAANQAASGGNQQRGRWIVVRDEQQKRAIADLNHAESAEFVKARIDRDESLPHHDAVTRARMLDAVLYLAEHMHTYPALIVACIDFDERPKDVSASASSIWPGVQNLLLAARALGLGAVPTTYAINRRDEFEAILDLPPTMVAHALIPVGFPLGNFGPVKRQPVGEIMRFDRWSSQP